MLNDILVQCQKVSLGISHVDIQNCSCMCMEWLKRRDYMASRCSGPILNCQNHRKLHFSLLIPPRYCCLCSSLLRAFQIASSAPLFPISSLVRSWDVTCFVSKAFIRRKKPRKKKSACIHIPHCHCHCHSQPKEKTIHSSILYPYSRK